MGGINWERLEEILSHWGLAIDAQIKKGDELAEQNPELADQWAEKRAKLVQLRDNPGENAVKFQQAFTEAMGTILAGHGPVGKSHAHGG